MDNCSRVALNEAGSTTSSPRLAHTRCARLAQPRGFSPSLFPSCDLKLLTHPCRTLMQAAVPARLPPGATSSPWLPAWSALASAAQARCWPLAVAGNTTLPFPSVEGDHVFWVGSSSSADEVYQCKTASKRFEPVCRQPIDRLLFIMSTLVCVPLPVSRTGRPASVDRRPRAFRLPCQLHSVD